MLLWWLYLLWVLVCMWNWWVQKAARNQGSFRMLAMISKLDKLVRKNCKRKRLNKINAHFAIELVISHFCSGRGSFLRTNINQVGMRNKILYSYSTIWINNLPQVNTCWPIQGQEKPTSLSSLVSNNYKVQIPQSIAI